MMNLSKLITSSRIPPELYLRSVAAFSKPFSNIENEKIKPKYDGKIKAVLCTELGTLLKITKIEKPLMKPSHIRIAVKYVGLNFSDILMINGKYQEKPTMPFVPGAELSGEVIEISDEARNNFNIGDKVVCVAMKPCAMAEEIILPQNSVIKIPKNADLSKASALLISYSTAYVALTRTAEVKSGDVCFVTAAAGAVGMALVDLATNVFNCKVIGAVGSDIKINSVLKKGAYHVLNYSKDNIRNRIKEITENKGVDIVFDNVGGKKLFTETLKSLRFEGKFITIGYASGEIPLIPANQLLLKSISMRGIYWGSYSINNPKVFYDSIKKVLEYFADGKIHPEVGRSFKMDDINEAVQFVLDRKNIGKIVIEIN